MKKRILSMMLVSTMVIGLTACGSSSSKKDEDTDTASSTGDTNSYTISACLEEDNDYNENLLLGFTDALRDYFPRDTIVINKHTASENQTTTEIATLAASSSEKSDLIFTIGDKMLESMTAATETIPIVATGVVDFQSTLRIADTGSSSWDKTTGTNVTGVSTRPSIVDQVSLMIEATDDLQAVGLLFSPEDTDSIYQNELFERYLDQAGIAWKEYSIPATDIAIDDAEGESAQVLMPSKSVIRSARVGTDTATEALGENILSGLNSPASTRVATQSEFWNGGKVVTGSSNEAKSQDADDEASDDSSDKTSKDNSSDDSGNKSDDEKNQATSDKDGNISLNNNSEDKADSDDTEEAVPTMEELMTTVCNECSAIYIPYGSMLSDQMEVISSIADAAGVVIVAGDTNIGQSALVTLFYDPYDLGYKAGKKAVRVLQGEDITRLKIGYGDADNYVKLYNGTIAEAFGKTFPKSFSEIKEFLSTYEYGSKTSRHVTSTED